MAIAQCRVPVERAIRKCRRGSSFCPEGDRKLFQVVKGLQVSYRESDRVYAKHREMLEDVLKFVDIVPISIST